MGEGLAPELFFCRWIQGTEGSGRRIVDGSMDREIRKLGDFFRVVEGGCREVDETLVEILMKHPAKKRGGAYFFLKKTSRILMYVIFTNDFG